MSNIIFYASPSVMQNATNCRLGVHNHLLLVYIFFQIIPLLSEVFGSSRKENNMCILRRGQKWMKLISLWPICISINCKSKLLTSPVVITLKCNVAKKPTSTPYKVEREHEAYPKVFKRPAANLWRFLICTRCDAHPRFPAAANFFSVEDAMQHNSSKRAACV